MPCAGFVGLAQLAVLALKRLQLCRDLGWHADTSTAIDLGFLDPLVQRLRRTPDLGRDRYDRCPSRCVVAFVVQHHPHRTLTHFRRILVRCLACHRSTFSGVGASDKPGAVQVGRERIAATGERFELA